MIWFYRFELRLLPGATALTLYAPDWEQAKASPGYRDFLQAHRPRSLQVVEFPLGYPARQDRAATPEEIRNLSVQDGNFRNPRFQRAAPTYRYEYFGNQAVLEPLAWKLRAGYARCCAAWKSWMEQGRTELYDRLEQVCAGVISTRASITAKPFFEKRGYRVIREQQVERQGVALTNFVMEKRR